MAVSKGTRVPRLRRMSNYMQIYAYSATAPFGTFLRLMPSKHCDTRYVARQLARTAPPRRPRPCDTARRRRWAAVWPRHHPAPRSLHRSRRGRGTIYPILGRLTKEGLLDANWVEGEAPHPRKYYRLTKTGGRRLREMKTEWRAFAEKIDRLIAASPDREGERR